MSARAYPKHKYAAFVSYAFSDDDAYGDWIGTFHEELSSMAKAMLEDVEGGEKPLRRIRQNDIAGGKLDVALADSIRESFTLLVMVGRSYPKSEWCFQELELFREMHGEQVFNDRVMIVALAKDPMDKVAADPRWQRLGLDENVWLKAYDDDEPDDPVRPYFHDRKSGRSGIDETFFKLLKGIARRLVMLANQPLPEPAGMRVLVGAHPEELRAAVEPFMQRLRSGVEAGALASVEVLTMNDVRAAMGDPEPLKQRMRRFDELLLPFNGGQPEFGGLVPGGHLTMLRNAWADAHQGSERAQQQRFIDFTHCPTPQPASGHNEAVLAQIQAQAIKPTQLSYLPRDASAVHILIESNPEERDEWQRLADCIREVWVELVTGMPQQPTLELDFNEFPIDGNTQTGQDSVQNADAVLLLWGKKPPQSVEAAVINQGKKITTVGGDALGLVARLVPPRIDDPGTRMLGGWTVISFEPRPGSQGAQFRETDDSRLTLEGFLGRVLRRRLKPVGAAR
jgi:hypothetical protein